MKTFDNHSNQFALIAATFCLIGLALLLSVIIWHRQINDHPWFEKNGVAAATSTLQVASAVSAPTTVAPSSTQVPDSVLQTIITDPRNLIDYDQPSVELSPALKFLYTLESPDVFPAQR